MISHYKDGKPKIHETAFIAKNADIIGDVTIEKDASVWFQTVIRSDLAPVKIGKRSNIQDLTMIHQSPSLPTIVEDDVTVGHQVTLHACTIRNNALIGMGSLVLDGAEVGEHAFIGAGSLVTPGTKIPPRTLAFGSPARVVRALTDDDYKEMARINQSYAEKGAYYKNNTDL